MRQALPIVMLVSFAGACASQESANVRETAAATAASAQSADWVTYNGPLAGDRYSPLTQITTANVSQLRQQCVFDAPQRSTSRAASSL
jgi:glucose dehydrogenase